jgi:hypothetical protein
MRRGGDGICRAVLAACLGASACGVPVATLPGVLGPEAYPPAMVLATGAIGEDCGTSILFVPLRRASLADAVGRAIASVPEATLLIDVRIDTSVRATRDCIRVKGSAAKLVSSVVVPMTGDHHGHHDAPH